MLRGEPVCNAKDGRAGFCGKHRAEALAIFQSACDVSSAVKIEHDARGFSVVRGDKS